MFDLNTDLIPIIDYQLHQEFSAGFSSGGCTRSVPCGLPLNAFPFAGLDWNPGKAGLLFIAFPSGGLGWNGGKTATSGAFGNGCGANGGKTGTSGGCATTGSGPSSLSSSSSNSSSHHC